MKLLILNGPNLNLLGQREPDIYGRQSYDDLCKLIYEHAAAVGCQVELFQSNHEGTLIDAIQASRDGFGGIVINPGAYAHYSYAIYDALRCAPVPAVEVHISDINAREPFRAVSVTAPACVRVITGHGLAAISKPWTICSNTPITLWPHLPAAAQGRHLYDQQKALSYRRPRGS